MSTAARKARKRAGIKHTVTPKRKTVRVEPGGMGLMSRPEWTARFLARPSR